MTTALQDAATLGGFFAVTIDPDGPQWRPFPGPVEDRVTALAVRFTDGGAGGRRACASTDFLALAARVVSPPLATAVRHGVVPVLTTAALSVHERDGALGVASGLPQLPAGALVEAVIDTVLADLVAQYRDRFRLSGRVLWGNVASALAGAATVLGGPDAIAAVRTAIASGPLADSGFYESPGRFRRRSCCLYYRLPGGGLCGDCVLAGG